jgi:hypothetical protein
MPTDKFSRCPERSSQNGTSQAGQPRTPIRGQTSGKGGCQWGKSTTACPTSTGSKDAPTSQRHPRAFKGLTIGPRLDPLTPARLQVEDRLNPDIARFRFENTF